MQFLHFILKSRFLSLERYWRGTKSNMFLVECESLDSLSLLFGVPCHLLGLVIVGPLSFIKSTDLLKMLVIKKDDRLSTRSVFNWIQCYSPGVMPLS